MENAALVTGASSGIGQAIARRLLADGWTVHNFDLKQPPAQDRDGSHWTQVDLADSTALKHALEQLVADTPINGLVNNAAIGCMDLLEDTQVDEFDRSVAINMRAPMLCAQALIDGMKSRGFGRIVNISSRAHLGKTHRTAYAGTKGALISMSKVWALEYARDGVTCNSIAPGPVQTELFDRANPPDMPRTQAIIESIPNGRLGQPEDIAHAVSFFMDRRSGQVTGQVLYVCGGVTLARGGS